MRFLTSGRLFSRGRAGLGAALLVSTIAVLACASQALAATTLFWTNDNSGGPISYAALGGGAPHNLSTGEGDPVGIAMDLAHHRIYYSIRTGIDYMSLHGSAGGTFNTTGATIDSASSLAIDPAAGKLYWTNWDGQKISWANLDGSGGGDLPITGPAVNDPHGLVVDVKTGKLYWTNSAANTIASANLNGSDATVLPIASSYLNDPIGLAIDRASGRIYWANCSGNTISYAKLNGSGAGTLSTAPVAPNCPNGLAVDHAAGRLYWSNYDASPGTISYANLDGSGGGDLVSSTPPSPQRLALVKRPRATAAPKVSGKSRPGSKLTCSSRWAPDLLEAELYRAPENISYSWTRDGKVIAGATSHTITAQSAGHYRCAALATNFAGHARRVSAAHAVTAAKPPVAVGRPVIKGAARPGQRLSCVSRWKNGPVELTYRWYLKDKRVRGATHKTYTVKKSDTGSTLACQVTATNSQGSTTKRSKSVKVIS